MLKNLLRLVVVLIFCNTAAQSVAPDCALAIPICKDVLFSGTIEGFGIDDFNGAERSGCLQEGVLDGDFIESNSIWFRFKIANSGELGFNIRPLNPGDDLDFAVYGPNAVCGQLPQPVGADGTAFNCGISNFSFSPTSSLTGAGINPETGDQSVTYTPFFQVQEGEEYLLLINNYSSASDGLSIDFTGTAILADDGTNGLDCSIAVDLLEEQTGVLCEGEEYVLDGFWDRAVTYNWFVDTTPDNGSEDFTLITGENASTLTVTQTGIYRVHAITPQGYIEYDDVLITFLPVNTPQVINIDVVDFSDRNSINIELVNAAEFEFQLNGGPFQNSGFFDNAPPGLNTVYIRHNTLCGELTLEILVAGYQKFFTPNGDGIHETWNILGLETNSSGRVFIFDRYGKLLKQLFTAGSGWDGTFNGRPLPSSDYWFKLEFVDADNTPRTYKGHFTLKR